MEQGNRGTAATIGTQEVLPLSVYQTEHRIFAADSRSIRELEDESVHLVVTSPPYWTLKNYPAAVPGQLGAVPEYEGFLDDLDRMWSEAFRVLVPGGRMCVVVGDVCLSRRRAGRHRVIALHADISVRCVRLRFDYLTPIFWHKFANMSTEMDRPGSYFLGKPFEPNGILKNDTEYILMFRKPGGYRKPTDAQRKDSAIDKSDYFRWYRQIWEDVGGASLSDHPAPFPLEIPRRLVRMFSFTGDTVLDPFAGLGTTALAAALSRRNSVSYEIEPEYVAKATARLYEAGVRVTVHNREGF